MATFQNPSTYLPVTMQQFEDLTNELLVEMNKLVAPENTAITADTAQKFFDANYMAQVLMSAIHAYDHKHGWVNKSELFDSCVNRISCHVTYHAVQEIQAKLKLEAGVKPELVVADDGTSVG
jgi:uncharacterized protein (DUF488 family)